MRTLTLTTDFGTRDWFVGTMKGVILDRINRDSHPVYIVDICHDIEQGNLYQAAFVLHQAIPWFPMNAIHVAVIDPGVGSERRPMIIDSDSGIFVGPDNGIFSKILQDPSIHIKGVYQISHFESGWGSQVISQTFHGRDIFAPAAAQLASGVPPADAGPPIDNPVSLTFSQPVRVHNGIEFELIYRDRFGNLITNMPVIHFPPDDLKKYSGIVLGERAVNFSGVFTCYAEASSELPGFIPGSTGFWELACKNNSAAAQHFSNDFPNFPLGALLTK